MAAGPPTPASEAYRPNRFVSLPAELDPNTYDSSLEKRAADAERLAIRARLKRQYQLQLNNPNPPAIIVSGEGRAGRGRVVVCPPHPVSRSGARAWVLATLAALPAWGLLGPSPEPGGTWAALSEVSVAGPLGLHCGFLSIPGKSCLAPLGLC